MCALCIGTYLVVYTSMIMAKVLFFILLQATKMVALPGTDKPNIILMNMDDVNMNYLTRYTKV